MSSIDLIHDNVGLALGRIKAEYGVEASVVAKDKALDKFGYTAALVSGDGIVPLTILKYAVLSATNDMTHIVGGSGDTQSVTLEGHYLTADGQLVFHVQTATLTGVTPVVLAQPLARASRMVVPQGGVPTGPISVTIGSGGAATLRVAAGETQTEFTSTSISYKDFYLIRQWSVSVIGGTNVAVTARLRWRPLFDTAGNALTNPNWRYFGRRLLLADGENIAIEHHDLEIVPRNSDVQIVVSNGANTASVSGGIEGWLATDVAYLDVADPDPA